jgi:Tfp pilus assembly protein PilO
MAALKLTPAQEKQVLFGIGSVVGLILWVNFFLLPQTKALAEVRPLVEAQRQQLEQLKGELSRLPAMEAEIGRLSAEFPDPSSPLPPEEQLPQLLKTITDYARRSQVSLFTSKPTSDVNQLTPGVSGYLELYILVAVEGGYHAMGGFLDAVESSDLLIRAREMIISPNPENPTRHRGVFLFQSYLMPGPARKDAGG